MKKLSALMLLSATMILASCGKPAESKPVDSEPASETTSQTESKPESAPTSASTPAPSTPASSASTPASSPAASSSSRPASSSSRPASSPAASSSSEAPAQTSYAVTGADIVTENNKIYVKVTGTMSGYADANARKMAFGLATRQAPGESGDFTPTWVVGSETPAAADFTHAPTLTGENFELKVEITNVTFTGGKLYTIYAGPSDAYAAVNLTSGTGTGKAVINGCRVYVRSDFGGLAADELPPIELTESFVQVEGAKVYHYIGGLLNTAKLTEADFLAKHPYVNYETCSGSWKQNKLGTSTKTDLVSTVTQNGKHYIKVDITSLPEAKYQVKINLAADTDADTKMDAIIDGTANPTLFCSHSYAVYADSTKSAKEDMYGNCGLIIDHSDVHSPLERGEKTAGTDMYQVACPNGDYSYVEMDIADLTGTATNVGTDKKMNSGKYATFNITGLPAGEYAVYAKGHVSSGNEVASATVGMSTGAQMSTAGANGGDPVPGRYYAYVGAEATAEKVYTDTGDKNFNAIGLNDATKFLWTTEAIIPSMMISAGQTSFTFKHTGAGYSLTLESLRLVKVGNYMAPAKNVVFTEGAMKIEAEDYSVKHTIFTNTGEETNYTTNGSQYPANLDGTVTDDASASGGKYVHAVFREGWDNNKRSNMSGELQYRVNLAAATTVKIKAKIKSDMETEKVCFDLKVDGAAKGTFNAANTWVEVESAAMELAAGVHTISFIGQQLGSNEGYRSVLADIDCWSLVEQAA